MTLEELETLAKESIEFFKDSSIEPGFTVIIPGLRYGTKCRIAPGLSGDNLGHYPSDNGPTTHVYLYSDQVLKFVEANKESDRP